jgi:hypothetical protein
MALVRLMIPNMSGASSTAHRGEKNQWASGMAQKLPQIRSAISVAAT